MKKRKKLLSLIASGLLIISTTGCNAHLTVAGKEIFNFNDTQIEQPVQTEEKQQKQYQYEQTDETTKDEILSLLLTGEYTLYINEDKYVYNTEEMLKVLFDNAPQYEVKQDQGTRYLVRIYKDNNYVTFSVDTLDNAIRIEEFCFNGNDASGANASNVMAQYLYDVHFNEEDGTLGKKSNTTKEEEKSSEEKQKTVKEEKKERKKLETVCAYCQTQMYEDMLGSSHEDSFCSVNCQDKWYQEQREMNELKYNCQWCGNAMNQYQYDMWGGCCSELCAVQREGAAYEEAERNGEVGGQTLCGWCEKPIPDDQCFCSKECKNMHDEFYNN